MQKFVITAFSSPKPGSETDFNAWYDRDHMKDLLAIPGVVSGRRFAFSNCSLHQAPSAYLAIYELEIEDPAQVVDELMRKGAAGEMRLTDTIEEDVSRFWVWEEFASAGNKIAAD